MAAAIKTKALAIGGELTNVEAALHRTSGENTSKNPRFSMRSDFYGGRLISFQAAPLMEPALCKHRSSSPVVARLFGPAIFESSKLKVLFLGDGKDKRPDELPRAYTLTHSDLTAKLTLAVSQTINKAQIQGWYSRLQRDEVLAEWRKSQGSMSLHVHCHISGGHWLLDTIAKLRFYIFRKELPVVLEAFRYGDKGLLGKHPELEDALVWVYFHSNVTEFNRVECWGPLREAVKGASDESAMQAIHQAMDEINSGVKQGSSSVGEAANSLMKTIEANCSTNHANNWPAKRPERCPHPCNCCFPPLSLIPLPPSFALHQEEGEEEAPSVIL